MRTRQFANLPRQILSQKLLCAALMRNLDGSVGISILEATLTENIQAVHAQLIEQIATR